MRIQWTDGANRNLEQIETYIAQDNPTAAINTVLNIVQSIEILKTHPSVGRPGRVPGTRELVMTDIPYIVPYRARGEYIEILRVLHSAMQWPKRF